MPKAWKSCFIMKCSKMLKAEGKITDAIIENMITWRHSGFNVYCGPVLWPDNTTAVEDLSRYIVRACFSQDRLRYVPATETMDGRAKVIYTAKHGRSSQRFDALDWLAQLVTHIPNKGEQMVRYYGYYSNKSRGMRKKANADDAIPVLIESQRSTKAWRKNWALHSTAFTIASPAVARRRRQAQRGVRGADPGP
jgi:hypothetical protein